MVIRVRRGDTGHTDSILTIKPGFENGRLFGAHHNVFIDMWIELEFQSAFKVGVDLAYRIKMRYKLTVDPEESIRIEHLIYLVQGVIDRKSLIIQTDQKSDLILGVEVGNFLSGNGLYLIAQFAKEAGFVFSILRSEYVLKLGV